MSRVALDVVPDLARPEQVAKALVHASEIRDRARLAQEQVAAAQAHLDEAEKLDVETAAQRARTGEPLSTTPDAVKKSREQPETAKRNDAALTLALEGAEGDLATTMTEHSDEWLAALDAESGRARQDAVKALAALEVALADLTQAASASLWISSAKTDGRWDRRVPLASAGSVAPSSARMTANSAPLDRPTLLGFLRELVEPPPQSPRHLVHAQSSDTAS